MISFSFVFIRQYLAGEVLLIISFNAVWSTYHLCSGACGTCPGSSFATLTLVFIKLQRSNININYSE